MQPTNPGITRFGLLSAIEALASAQTSHTAGMRQSPQKWSSKADRKSAFKKSRQANARVKRAKLSRRINRGHGQN